MTKSGLAALALLVFAGCTSSTTGGSSNGGTPDGAVSVVDGGASSGGAGSSSSASMASSGRTSSGGATSSSGVPSSSGGASSGGISSSGGGTSMPGSTSSSSGNAADAGLPPDGGTSTADAGNPPDSGVTADAGPTCGNGRVDLGEQCDFGAGNSDTIPNRCRLDCTDARCGDGVVDLGEECDNASANSDTLTNACRSTCVDAYCGDGVQDTGEGCDQGASNSNTTPGACRTTCQPASCGDGVVDQGESCDNGPANSDTAANACRLNCQAAHCGDGVLDTSEACDDGNLRGGDGCRNCAVEQTCAVALDSDGTGSYLATYSVDPTTGAIAVLGNVQVSAYQSPLGRAARVAQCGEDFYAITANDLGTAIIHARLGVAGTVELRAFTPLADTALAIACDAAAPVLHALTYQAPTLTHHAFPRGLDGALGVPVSTATSLPGGGLDVQGGLAARPDGSAWVTGFNLTMSTASSGVALVGPSGGGYAETGALMQSNQGITAALAAPGGDLVYVFLEPGRGLCLSTAREVSGAVTIAGTPSCKSVVTANTYELSITRAGDVVLAGRDYALRSPQGALGPLQLATDLATEEWHHGASLDGRFFVVCAPGVCVTLRLEDLSFQLVTLVPKNPNTLGLRTFGCLP